MDPSFMQQVQSAAGPVVSAVSAVTPLCSPGKLEEFSDNVRGRAQLGEASNCHRHHNINSSFRLDVKLNYYAIYFLLDCYFQQRGTFGFGQWLDLEISAHHSNVE